MQQTKKTMKKVFISIFILSSLACTNAKALTDIEIEKLAANKANCSTEHPCIVSVTTDKDEYRVKVNRSTLITPDGILKFRTGSVINYIFRLDGFLEKEIPTT
jgi:hypothetical protein